MRDRFRLMVHEASGQSYEDLFIKIMGYAEPTFQPVKAHGNIGDRGNDGWCAHSGKYYQVYAPEDLPKNNDESLKKMKTDFNKLYSFWNTIEPVREFYFVLNDKFKGAPPHLLSTIADIKKQYNLRNAGVFLSGNLENMLFSQSQSVIDAVVGCGSLNQRKSVYQHLIEGLTLKMHLDIWPLISDNLIANAIDSRILDGFSEASVLIFRTQLPSEFPALNTSISDLAFHTEALVSHFTNSSNATLSEDKKWWRRDMTWKKVWMKEDVYQKKYEQSEQWRKQLNILHMNLVHALNIFSNEVRLNINPNYMMGQQFTVVDSLGVYNGLSGYEAIPNKYQPLN